MKTATNKQFVVLQVIAICLVLIGHKNAAGFKDFGEWFSIYAYHMSLFIFVSGYFYSTYNLNVWEYLWKKIKKLVIPYFIYNLIYGIIITYLRHKNIVSFGSDLSFKSFFIDSWINGQQYALNIPTWFVLTLFSVQVVYTFIQHFCIKYHRQNNLFLFILFLIGGIFSTNYSDFFNSSLDSLYLPFFKILFFLPFFHFGFYYKNELEEKDRVSNFVYLAILFLAIEIINLKFNNNPYFYILARMNFNGHSISPFVTSFIGILFFLRVSKILSQYIGNNRIIQYIGRNTWDIMTHHLFVFFLINLFFLHYNINNFNIGEFKTDVFYNFTPNKPNLIYFYYLLAIFIPLGFRLVLNKTKLIAKTSYNKYLQGKKK